MNAKEYVRRSLLEQDRQNVEDTQFELLCHMEEDAPLPKYLDEKIDLRATKYGLKRSQIIASGVSDLLAATTLAKSANRQNFPEALQIKYLNTYRSKSIEKLPENGLGSIRIQNGELLYNTTRARMTATKTIDGQDKNQFISFKYIEQAGGSQDNQILDVINFLTEAVKYTLNNNNAVTFAAVIDGDYGESKIPELSKLVNDNFRVNVFTSDTYKKVAFTTKKRLTTKVIYNS